MCVSRVFYVSRVFFLLMSLSFSGLHFCVLIDRVWKHIDGDIIIIFLILIDILGTHTVAYNI